MQLNSGLCQHSASKLHQEMRYTEIASSKRGRELRALNKAPFDSRDIKIVRCSLCGYESRMTLGWIQSHRTFQCAGCGEERRLHINKIRKAFDAAAKALADMRHKLSG